MKERFDALYGNERLKTYLTAAADRGSLSHAYLIEGAAGTGRHLVASLIAKTLVCTASSGKPCGVCLACRKVELGEHPDVLTYSVPRDRKTIGVDTVRAVREEAYYTPNESDRRVFVIENAEAMTVQAQNALLKILEEPPAAAAFLLITESLSSMIPTIQSRAAILRTERFSAEALDGYLTENEPKARALKESDPDAYQAVLRLSDGSAGKALTLLGSKKDGQEVKEAAAAEHVAELLSSGTHPELLLYLNGAAATRDALIRLCELIALAMRDLVAIRTAKNAKCLFFADSEKARAISDRLTIAALLRMGQIASAAAGDLNANVNVQTARILLAEALFEARSV